MGYTEHDPGPALRRDVCCIWTWDGPDAGPHRVLPDGCVDVILDVHDGAAMVVGTMTRPLVVPRRESDLVAARFRPGRAGAWFDVPLDDLTDAHADLGDLWRDAQGVLERVLAVDEPAARAARLSCAIAARAPRSGGDPLVSAAVAAISADHAVRVADLAERLGVTRQHLTRRFRAGVGIGPKELARVLRFSRAVDRAVALDDIDWAGLAWSCGFADQAHLCHEFRALAGLAPTRWLAARRARAR